MVFSPVSSRKTRWRKSQCRRFCIHAWRAASMSGRSCSAARSVFFIAQIEPFKPVPQGRCSHGNAQLLTQSLADLLQGHAPVRFDPLLQTLIMPGQSGNPIASALLWCDRSCLGLPLTIPLHTPLGDPKNHGEFGCALPSLSPGDYPFPQILAVGLHPSLLPECAQDATH